MNRIFSICHRAPPFLSARLLHQKVPTRSFCSRSAILDPNTNVAKDVILYKYENARLYKLISIFAVIQFGFWNYLSIFSYSTLRDAPVEEKDPATLRFWEKINLGENKYRNSIAIICGLMGWCTLATAWIFTLRSVRYLVLQKGGNSVAFVTYSPFGPNRIMSVPINCISAVESRSLAKTTLPIKVKNKSLFYILDMKGEFKNPLLFDQTAGLSRKWAK